MTLGGPWAEGNSLSLKDYMEQVGQGNPAHKAATQNREGAQLRKKEGHLIFMPTIELELAQSIEKKDTLTPNITGDKSEYKSYKASLTQVTPLGLNLKLGYDQLYRNTEGAGAAFLPVPEYSSVNPYVEAQFSLWRNFWGEEVSAAKEALTSAAEAAYHAESFKEVALNMEAQTAFLNLHYARETVQALKESLAVSEKMLKWAKDRFDRELADRSDYLQTKAAHELRNLEYIQAQQNEKIASRMLNSLRGVDSDVVSESLDAPKVLPKPPVLSGSGSIYRDDTRALQKELEANRANSRLEKEKNKPSLNLFAQYGHYSLDKSDTQARKDAFRDDFPYHTVGVRFSAPLAFGTSRDVQKGYAKEVLAAQFNVERKSQEQIRDYQNITSQVETLQRKLELAKILEESQRQKSSVERSRYNLGKATLFQALQFEQDYVSARLNTIQTESELNQMIIQMQMYKEEK